MQKRNAAEQGGRAVEPKNYQELTDLLEEQGAYFDVSKITCNPFELPDLP